MTSATKMTDRKKTCTRQGYFTSTSRGTKKEEGEEEEEDRWRMGMGMRNGLCTGCVWINRQHSCIQSIHDRSRHVDTHGVESVFLVLAIHLSFFHIFLFPSFSLGHAEWKKKKRVPQIGPALGIRVSCDGRKMLQRQRRGQI